MSNPASKSPNGIFEFGGIREAVLTIEKAEALLAQVSHIRDPQHIRLSNKSFSPEAATCIAEVLRGFKNIDTAEISDIIAGRAEEDALRTLKIICDSIEGNSLIELNVSDNALGSKGVKACQSLFVCKSLKCLYACNNGLSGDACDLVAELLLGGGCPLLTTLHFYNNMSGDGGAVAIAGIVKACPQLEDFRFSATRSSYEGCLVISKALTTLHALKRLDLQDNSFSEQAGELLASSIKMQSSLVHLNLRDAGLKEKGTSQVIQALIAGKQCLQVLDLSGNDVSTSNAKELRDLLRCPHMHGLKELSLDDNELESEGAVFISQGIQGLNCLETLCVCTCEITAAGAYTLSRVVSDLPSFLTLKADGNRIFPRGLQEIETLLIAAGKILADMEDNDEDGDEDGFEEALEIAEKANKNKAQDTAKAHTEAQNKKDSAATSTPVNVAEQSTAHPPLSPVATSPTPPVSASEDDEVTNTSTNVASPSMVPVEVKVDKSVSVLDPPLSLSADAEDDADDLVSAMQSASISGSRISDMPTP